ncbi:type IV toxin-antitoxin system AbiEi family antitoxin domain-containing protein [Hyalangium sp.]|uniref:type IV toxin-antitoxin system AbiEi family antitoxin domain-containing protein n=1 Tax=Hyalangium sp. TaxID=2028555 RepID=UPI002D5AF98A|nr:type IV toxin-antitoxin system AbiEi family antitoxin domain-containing protein [Hyalangium sp.]HYH97284.1 type IV toxin-antitoxin system AbiEi family antitoxin domain-containing protein [Hyalangium sp.]
MGVEKPDKPDWNRLYEVASAQDGYFSTRQAGTAGYLSQLLLKHIRGGRIARVRRGVYRLVHYPAGEHEDLTIVWLWSEQAGVFSHQTALALHGLSDVLPAQIHLTIPAAWRNRRFRVPGDVVLHHGDVAVDEEEWFGAVPVTSPQRTLEDCAEVMLAPDLVHDAFEQAAARGLIDRNSVPGVIAYLKQFFSVSRSASGPHFGSVSGSASGAWGRSSSGSRSAGRTVRR